MKTIPNEFIESTWQQMYQCPQHTFLILTKRPHRMLEFVTNVAIPKYGILSNVYFGCTVVNQQEADEKIPIFLDVPGKKFLSIEPMLGEIDIPYLARCEGCGEWLSGSEINHGRRVSEDTQEPCGPRNPQIYAVILGGETGPGARPMHLDWAISIVQQCKTAGVPVFVKQIHVNGKTSKDISEWPEELMVRELPWVES